jgi:hypothetical protein
MTEGKIAGEVWNTDSNQLIGKVRNYNSKRHEGYVTLFRVGTEEWGAMPSNQEVRVDGKRIPNKWDNKVDPNRAFFGDAF